MKLGCTLFFCLLSSLSAAEPNMLTLGECQRRTLKTSESLTQRELATKIAEEKINEIRGINRPKVLFDAEYGKRNNHLGSITPNRMKDFSLSHPLDEEGDKTHTKMPDKIKSVHARKEEWTTKTSLIVPIYDSGYVSNRTEAQEYIIEATRRSRDELEQELLHEVAQKYYLLLESKKIEEVVLQSIATLHQALETTKDLFSIGYVTANDVLVLEVQLSERKQEQIQAQNSMELLHASLNRLMGQELDTPFEIEEVTTHPEWDTQYEYFKELADITHPELKKIVAEQQANQSEYKAIQAENRPTIKGIVSYNTSSNPFLLHRSWFFGGVGLQIPLFDGGIVESKLRQNTLENETLGLSYQSAQKNIHLHIKRAFLRAKNAWSRVPVAKQSIQAAEENLRMTSEQYVEGLITSDDLLNNEERLAQARSNYYRALYQFYIAKADLEFAAGTLSPNQST